MTYAVLLLLTYAVASCRCVEGCEGTQDEGCPFRLVLTSAFKGARLVPFAVPLLLVCAVMSCEYKEGWEGKEDEGCSFRLVVRSRFSANWGRGGWTKAWCPSSCHLSPFFAVGVTGGDC